MLTSISCSHLYVLDQDQALDFYVGVLGMQVHTDADLGFMRWLTVCVPGEPGRQILLEKPGPPALDEATAATARELLSKGAAGGWLMLTTDDARGTYEQLKTRGVEFTSEPTEQPYGIDFGLRDPFGNHLRVGQLTAASQAAQAN
jgi:catechol 2,3-dioxygenase-like lactoylglutathione lyase family enzyme